jgi:hypothetical protein
MVQRTIHVTALSALLVAGSIGLALAQGGGGGGGGAGGGGAGGAGGAAGAGGSTGGGVSSGTSPGGMTGPGGTTGAGPSSGSQTSPGGTGLNNNTRNNRPCGPGSLGSNTGTSTGSTGTTTGSGSSADLNQQPNIATGNDPTKGTNQTAPSTNPQTGTGSTLGSGC